MTKKEKRHQGILIVGVLFVLIIVGLLGFGVLSVISVGEDFTLNVAEYVGTGDSKTNTKNTETFNESIVFDFAITNSVNQDDTLLYIVDGSGDKKLLFKQYYDWECDGTKLVNHPFTAKMRVTHNNNVITLDNALTGEVYNYVTKAGDFGEEPYYIEFYVKRARSSNYYYCGNSGISYFDGRMSVSNIILADTEVSPIIIEEEEAIVNETDNEVTGDVVSENFFSNFVGLRMYSFYIGIGLLIAGLIVVTIVMRRNKDKGL